VLASFLLFAAAATAAIPSGPYRGPIDPSAPETPIACNKHVAKAIEDIWARTLSVAFGNPTHTHPTWGEKSWLYEFGFSIEYDSDTNSLWTSPLTTSWRNDHPKGPNHLSIPVGDRTVAVVHSHNLGVEPTPSPADVQSLLPIFVVSREGLFVTLPGQTDYRKIDVKRVCNK
jgi:hypothetical protein